VDLDSRLPPAGTLAAMRAVHLSADDLLPLCGTAQRAVSELRGLSPAPRVETLRRLGAFVTARMTDAALAYERDTAGQEHQAGLLDAAEALAYADALQDIGVDGHGYVGGSSAAGPVEAPDGDERDAHARFLDATSGLAGALRVIAEHLDEPPATRPVEAAEDVLFDLADEALVRLREGTATAPPTGRSQREAAMVWLSFCGLVLDRALAAQSALEGTRDEAEIAEAVWRVPRLPHLYRAIAEPVAGSSRLLDLAARAAGGR
jgi:hypothetical protein